jgi:two-component system sensor histidine kinase PilS (NtrC family)
MVNCCILKALTPVHNTNGQLRQHILWLLLIRVIFFTLLIGITAILDSNGNRVILPPASITLAFLSILFIFSIGSAAILQKEGLHLRRFGLIQFLSDTLFAALLVYGTGCSQSIFTPVFILPVIAGGLIMYRIGGLMSAAAATILYGSILFLEYINYLPSYIVDTDYVPFHDILKATNLFSVYGVTFFLTAFLSGTLAARLRSTEEELTKTSLEFDRLTLLYKQIFDDISTGIITIDDVGMITSYNAAAGRITGFPPTEVIGQILADFFPSLYLKEMSVRQVVDLKKKDGTIIRAGYSFTRLNLPLDPELADATCNNCKVITLQDISSIEKMEKRVNEAEKMAAIGELSASIAHDFRNPLAAISGSAQLLALERQGKSKTEKTLCTIIERESNRMAKTITDFLQFARPADIQGEWFDMQRLVMETLVTEKQLQERYKKGLIKIDIPENFDGYGDRQQLQTVLAHLVENSTRFSEDEDGPITISAYEDKLEGNNSICLEIADQGVGILPEIEKKIFRPFFSTRENGTGLGLSIVQQIIEHHRGSIKVISTPGAGCIMRIALPLPSSKVDKTNSRA